MDKSIEHEGKRHAARDFSDLKAIPEISGLEIETACYRIVANPVLSEEPVDCPRCAAIQSGANWK